MVAAALCVLIALLLRPRRAPEPDLARAEPERTGRRGVEGASTWDSLSAYVKREVTRAAPKLVGRDIRQRDNRPLSRDETAPPAPARPPIQEGGREIIDSLLETEDVRGGGQ
jgi:hypothetical protein